MKIEYTDGYLELNNGLFTALGAYAHKKYFAIQEILRNIPECLKKRQEQKGVTVYAN